MLKEDHHVQRVLVLGAGNFGTCLAQHLANNHHAITLWSIDEDIVSSINKHRRNPKYLSSAILSEQIQATNKISRQLLEDTDALIIAVPTQAMREVLNQLKSILPERVLIVCAAKGLEIDTVELPIGIIRESLGDEFARKATFLSGPSFAAEIIERQPTAVSIASHDAARAKAAQDLFHAPLFRVYTSDDPVGLEIAGALKNVIAIAAGAVVGLGFQNNSRAALLTRGLAEIARMGVALGANPLTFNGLGGVGDLFLTCTSEKSRNFSVGYRLGRGETLKDIMKSMDSVAEGVFTAKALRTLMQRTGVCMPISEEVYSVLYEGKPITEAVTTLLTREPRAEIDAS